VFLYTPTLSQSMKSSATTALLLICSGPSAESFPFSTGPDFTSYARRGRNRNRSTSPSRDDTDVNFSAWRRPTRDASGGLVSLTVAAASSGFSFAPLKKLASFPWTGKKLVPIRPGPIVQVISDVDDTIKSSGGIEVGGIALGGIDTQYARGDFYPGVFQFMFEMSSYRSNCGDGRAGAERGEEGSPRPAVAPPPMNVAVLTARADEFRLALELKPSSKLNVAFRNAGTAAGVSGWGVGPVLYGSVAEWIVQDRKGLRKFNNFERLLEQGRELNPDAPYDLPGAGALTYAYVGDTGERDQEAGETMLREYPELVLAVFLHTVAYKTWPVPMPPTKLINGRPVVFFRTYVGAAAKAVQLGLMDVAGMERVIDAAESALGAIRPADSKWVDVRADIKNAREMFDTKSS